MYFIKLIAVQTVFLEFSEPVHFILFWIIILVYFIVWGWCDLSLPLRFPR